MSAGGYLENLSESGFEESAFGTPVTIGIKDMSSGNEERKASM